MDILSTIHTIYNLLKYISKNDRERAENGWLLSYQALSDHVFEMKTQIVDTVGATTDHSIHNPSAIFTGNVWFGWTLKQSNLHSGMM